MEESNRLLSLLLVAAIIVSLGGTIVSLQRLGQINIQDLLTAKATSEQTGIVQFDISSQTEMTVTQAVIDFGNGYVNSSCNNCTMWTNSSTSGTNYSDAACCLGEWYPLDTDADTGLYFKNEGNTNLSVQINFSANASGFIGGSLPNPEFQYIAKSDSNARNCTSSSCTATNDDTSSSCSWASTTDWVTINTTIYYICGSASTEPFKPISTQDEAVIDIRVVVPRTALTSAKTATVSFVGTSP